MHAFLQEHNVQNTTGKTVLFLIQLNEWCMTQAYKEHQRENPLVMHYPSGPASSIIQFIRFA